MRAGRYPASLFGDRRPMEQTVPIPCSTPESPALGYALFYVFKDQAFEAPLEQPARAENYALENQFLRVEFDPFSGCINQLF